MKLLSIPLIALAITSCGYPSATEAYGACRAWAFAGGKFTKFIPRTKYTDGYLRTLNVRECDEDLKTRQYLGWSYQVKPDTQANNAVNKVVKRFRY